MYIMYTINNIMHVYVLLLYYCLYVNYIVVNPFYTIQFSLFKNIKVLNRLKEVFKLTDTYIINICNC